MLKVAIFANDDLTSSLIFGRLFENPEVKVVGVYIASSALRGHGSQMAGAFRLRQKMAGAYWNYLAFTNGIFKLFDLLTCWLSLRPSNGPLVSLRRHAQLQSVPVESTKEFGSEAILGRLTADEVDLLVIRVGEVLGEEVLQVPKFGTWCVHSSILPSFKGIAGEFHALRTPGAKIGSTVFWVTPVLDEGPIVGQVEIARHESQSVFAHTMENNEAAGVLLISHIQQLSRIGYTVPTSLNWGVTSSYHSWPCREEVLHLRRSDIKLIAFGEVVSLILHALRLRRTWRKDVQISSW